MKSEGLTLSLAGSCANANADFCALASLHQLISVYTGHIAKSVCQVFHASCRNIRDKVMHNPVRAMRYAAGTVSRDHMDIAGASFDCFEKNLLGSRTEPCAGTKLSWLDQFRLGIS